MQNQNVVFDSFVSHSICVIIGKPYTKTIYGIEFENALRLCIVLCTVLEGMDDPQEDYMFPDEDWRSAEDALALDHESGCTLKSCLHAEMVQDAIETFTKSMNEAYLHEQDEETLRIASKTTNCAVHRHELMPKTNVETDVENAVSKHLKEKANAQKRLSRTRQEAHESNTRIIIESLGRHYKIGAHCLHDDLDSTFLLKDTVGNCLRLQRMSEEDKRRTIMQRLNGEQVQVDGKKLWRLKEGSQHFACWNCFCEYNCVSPRTAARYKKLLQENQGHVMTRAESAEMKKYKVDVKAQTLRCEDWIVQQIKFYGEYMPHTDKIHLKFLSQKWLHEKYEAAMEKDALKAVCKTNFIQILKSFSNVIRVIAYKDFATCDLCAQLDKLKNSPLENVRLDSVRRKEKHMEEVRNDTQMLLGIQKIAKKYHRNLVSIGLDGMTQNTTRLPYCLNRTKLIDQAADLPAAVYGGLVHGGAPGISNLFHSCKL